MKRFDSQKYMIITLAVVVVIFIAQAINYFAGGQKEDDIKQISLIVYGGDAARWDNLKEGVELACSGSEIEISLVTMANPFDYKEQCQLIDREVENGADGIIIAACNSEKINNYLLGKEYRIPVIYAESGGGDKGYCELISADNYELGSKLAEQIIENEKDWIKVAIVSDSLDRDSVYARREGVYESLSKYTSNIVYWDRNENESGLTTRKYLQRWLVEEAVDVVVTLDSESTDALMDAMDNLNKNRKVYSISTSNKSVYYLDRNRIKALMYQDEFSIGYTSAAEILEQIGERAPEIDKQQVASKIVVKSDIYIGENERILFPFVR